MEIEEGASGGQSVLLVAGEDLRQVPRSHRRLLTADIREAFADPAGYFGRIARRCPFPQMSRWLQRLVTEGRWALRLHRGSSDEWSLAGFDWKADAFRGATISLPTDADRSGYPDDLRDYYALVDLVHWNQFGCGGGLERATEHLRLNFYSFAYRGHPVDPNRTFVWGYSFCGDILLYTDDGRAGWICHETGHVHLLGTIAETLDWVFGQLLADRFPDYDHRWAHPEPAPAGPPPVPVPLPPGSEPAEIPRRAVLGGHYRMVRVTAFSPDGATLATAGDDHTVRLWDVETGIERLRFEHRSEGGGFEKVSALAWSPDGTTLATATNGQTVQVWGAATGAEYQVFEAPESLIFDLAYSPDGTCLAVGGDDRLLKVLDLATGTVRSELDQQNEMVIALAFSPDGRTLAVVSQRVEDVTFFPAEIELWDLPSGAIRARLSDPGDPHCVAYSPDGRWLASGTGAGPVNLWDPATGERRAVLAGHGGRVLAVAFGAGGRVLASQAAAPDGVDEYLSDVRVWDLESRKGLARWTSPAYLNAFGLSPDGRLAAGGVFEQAILWDVPTPQGMAAEPLPAPDKPSRSTSAGRPSP